MGVSEKGWKKVSEFFPCGEGLAGWRRYRYWH
jgi:hypothetical protein